MEGKRQLVTPQRILFLFILINLVAAAFIVPDYGTGTDEALDESRSQLALQVYSGKIDYSLEQAYEDVGDVRYYGTAVSVLFRFAEKYLFPGMDHRAKEVAHYGYFVFFQIAVIAMFYLGRNFFSDWLSLLVALLFGTQPLLFGHAFINPKDIPLLAVFLLSVVAGFQMVDRWGLLSAQTQTQGDDAESRRSSKKGWVFWLGLIGLFLLVWFSNGIMNAGQGVIERACTNNESGVLGKIFSALAVQGSPEDCQVLAMVNLWLGTKGLFLVTPGILALLYRYAVKHKLLGSYIQFPLMWAAFIWGFALSTRVIAIAAGGIVGLYALLKFKKKALLPLSVYTLTAAVISYISWPYLWAIGIRAFWNSLVVFSDYVHVPEVLFEGKMVLGTDLPARFLPKLMLLQFTEPVVILALLGFVIGVSQVYRKKVSFEKFFLLFGWFALPLLYTIFRNTTNYSNFRQYLFVTPPLFVFAGFALQPLARLVKRRIWMALASVALLLPGIVNIVHLHPYEYIYYNQFVGGVAGANEQYELDYWLTSYKEMMGYVTSHLPGSSRVLVIGNDSRVRIFAENPRNFVSYQAVAEENYAEFDYAIIPVPNISIRPQLASLPLVHAVEVDNARLMLLVKIPAPGD